MKILQWQRQWHGSLIFSVPLRKQPVSLSPLVVVCALLVMRVPGWASLSTAPGVTLVARPRGIKVARASSIYSICWKHNISEDRGQHTVSKKWKDVGLPTCIGPTISALEQEESEHGREGLLSEQQIYLGWPITTLAKWLNDFHWWPVWPMPEKKPFLF